MKPIVKSVFSLIALLMLCGLPVIAKNDKGETTGKIVLTQISGTAKRDRSQSMSIEAYYNELLSTVDIICYGAKETSIYIVDAAGDVAGYDTFDFSVSPYFTMDAPVEKGTYWLVLDSAELYAEGNFVVQ